MNSNFCCAVLLSALSTPTLASNFSYSHLGVDLGQVNLDDDFIIAGEKYDSFGFFSLGGGYQFTDNVAFSLTSSAYATEEGNTELTVSFVEIYLHFPIPVSESVDITPFFGYRRDEVEA
ncbi:MAG: outer membrane beta-barrel protein, partial [Pseudomonadales bacterium]